MYFPAYLNLNKKKVLVVGGGKIAADKISHLLDFTTDITIIAPKIEQRVQEFIEKYSLNYINKEYEKNDIEGFFVVIVAVDSIELQKEIFTEAKDKKILVNSVDSVEFCDFIFPSYIKRGDLIISFSTSGTSPSLSKYLRRAIEKLIPTSIEEFLKELKTIRTTMPKGKKRMEILDKMAKEYIQKHFRSSE
jgi:precorrin-2 dehydrogenase/sirohydrochlorin ferrochelatase